MSTGNQSRWWQALRPKQWVKNAVVFVPLVFGKKLGTFSETWQVCLAFLCFSLAASAMYLFNDLLDLAADRAHPTKRWRPIASGHVSTRQARWMVGGIGAVAVGGAFAVHAWLGWLVASYMVISAAYSVVLKHVVLLDVFSIAGLFLLRMIAGTVIAGVEFSHWMTFMVVLLALFLGFGKRWREIAVAGAEAVLQRPALGQYHRHFLDQILTILTTCILLTYTVYTVDERTVGFFGNTRLLASVPFVYFGVFRFFYLMHTEGEREDPITIFFRDWQSIVNLVLWIGVCVGVIYFR